MPMNISLFFQEDHGTTHNIILTTGIDWMINELPWWIEGNLNPVSPSSFCIELITSDWLSKTSNCWYYYLFCLWNSRQIDKLRKSQKNLFISASSEIPEKWRTCEMLIFYAGLWSILLQFYFYFVLCFYFYLYLIVFNYCFNWLLFYTSQSYIWDMGDYITLMNKK